MLNEPPVDVLCNNLGEEYKGSKFALCIVTAKRARQLIEISKNSINSTILNNEKPLTAATLEVKSGKISVSNN